MLNATRSPSRIVQTLQSARFQTLQCHHSRYSNPLHQWRRSLLTLAIETSCDDTAVAILQTTGTTVSSRHSNPESRLLSSTTSSPQALRDGLSRNDNGPVSAKILFHEKVTARNTGLGGIHPLEALESHQVNLAQLIAKAITFLPNDTTKQKQQQGALEPKESHARSGQVDKVSTSGRQTTKILPDFVTVTRGPGMRSNLSCGIDTAKGLALAWQVPLLGVHHMQAHALTPRLVDALRRGDEQHEQQKTQQGNGGKNIGVGESQTSASSLSNVSNSQEVNSRTRPTKLRPEFPFITLLVSGGHTMLVHSKGLVDHHVIATTRDIAIGDALDKCGRIILPDDVKSEMQDTAFAKYLSEWASKNGDPTNLWPVPQRRQFEINKPDNEYGWQVQAPLADTKDMAFSFTSITTQIERLFKQRSDAAGGEIDPTERQMFARTALGISFEHLCSRTVMAIQNLRTAGHEISTLVVSGGVAANSFLRLFLRSMLDVRGLQDVEILFPPPWLCTDNAVMIAWTGIEMFEAGFQSQLDIRSIRKWSMDTVAEHDGIIGVGGWMQSSLDAQFPGNAAVERFEETR